MTHRARGSNVTRGILTVALHVVSVVSEYLQLGLSRWAIEQEEPCTAQMIALQKAGRRTHPALLTRLMKMNRKRKAVRSWTELGLQVETSTEALNARAAAQYMWALRRLTVGSATTKWRPKKHKRRIGIGRQTEPLGKKHERCDAKEIQALPLASGEFRVPWLREPSWVFSVAESIWGRLQRDIAMGRHSLGWIFLPPLTLVDNGGP